MLLNEGIYNGQRILGRKTLELMNSDQLAKMDIQERSFLGENGNSHGLAFALITEKSMSHLQGSPGSFYFFE